MSLVINSKYVYDTSGKIIEVILPIDQFEELRRRALASPDNAIKFSRAAPAEPPELGAHEMTQMALLGGAFDWLKDEPELYSDQDGEPV